MSTPQLVLASASPRRRALLRQIGVPFDTATADLDETPLPGERPADYVARLAQAKAAAVSVELAPDTVVLGSDTAVVLDDQILGKPRDRAEGLDMLTRLSGREHEVLTAIAVHAGDVSRVQVVRTVVGFRTITQAQREAYWATGEPADKAGGYGIQGLAAVFVSHVNGSYSAVVGLPLCETAELLGAFGISCWQTMSET